MAPNLTGIAQPKSERRQLSRSDLVQNNLYSCHVFDEYMKLASHSPLPMLLTLEYDVHLACVVETEHGFSLAQTHFSLPSFGRIRNCTVPKPTCIHLGAETGNLLS